MPFSKFSEVFTEPFIREAKWETRSKVQATRLSATVPVRCRRRKSLTDEEWNDSWTPSLRAAYWVMG